MLNRMMSLFGVGLMALLLSACTMGLDYQQPDTMIPPSYKQDARWKEAEPQATLEKGAWWEIYHDPVLNGLEHRAIEANQSLQAAFFRVQQVRAGQRLSEAERLPQINLSGSGSRERTAGDFSSDGHGRTGNIFSLPFLLSYEIDLWGRTRRSLEAASAESESAVADYHAALLSLQADVARYYFNLRALDNEISLLEQTLGLLREALLLVRSQYENGQVSRLNLAQAETELANVQAEAVGLERQRSDLVNAIAVLIGVPSSDFTLAAEPREMNPPKISPGLPSSLLERRPDISAAERQMAAASARIGVARAAFFPSISLTGKAGFASEEIGSLFEWDNRTWGFGPALYLPIFDAGRNSAKLERAKLGFEAAVATYRQQVLVAFEEVENGLQGLEHLQRQEALLQQALETAGDALDLSNKRYRSGYVSYLEVIDTQRTALQIARSLSRLQGQQMVTSTLLIKALGGGWQTL
ncbi:MAG: efflux transporter outer membrane subunit [Desulfuromonadales bacterium]|nr:efflux transporter outer membrane subunit [Desulfuromonadales bacterium]